MSKIGNQIASSVYIVAEISGNHQGSLDKAKELISEAKNAGADAVKFQAYTPDSITLDSSKSDFMVPKGNAWQDYATLYSLYVEAHTPFDWIPDLIATAKEVSIPIFASVFDLASIEILESHSLFAYKIASPEVSDVGILERVARTEKPIFISTGLSDLSEIYNAHQSLRQNGASEIYWLKANTSYPPPVNEINLRTISNLSQILESPVGFSDHTLGHVVSVAAVACGARIIEKHLKLRDDISSVDSFFSLDPIEFKEMVTAIRTVEVALGKVSYEIPDSSKAYLNGKRSLYIARNVSQGEKFTVLNVKSVRPSYSLGTHFLPLVLKSRAKRDLEIGDRISLGDLEIDE